MLSPYRVLDLANEQGLFCGKILGDLGADVIKVERPGGDPARNLGPFYHDEPDPEKSLFWWAFNTSKRGITLDIDTVDGQEIFKRLVKSADAVIESFPVEYMDRLGLGYPALEKLNPGIILVSITPFGQTGPYKDFKAPDIVAFALGGRMYSIGDADRPPVRISHHSQAYLHAGGEGAVGAMLALYHREMTGEGQQVDVSIQASVAQILQGSSVWDAVKEFPRRGGMVPSTGRPARFKHIWPCKDGHVIWAYWGGGPLARRFTMPLIEWMDSEGIAVDFLKEFDWENLNLAEVSDELAKRMQEPVAEFFMTHTRAELLEGAVKHHAMLGPVATTEDTLESVQLAARKYWAEVEHPELRTYITYPGAFVKASEAPPRISQRAPLIGEHNQEVYEKELGLSKEEILTLKTANVI